MIRRLVVSLEIPWRVSALVREITRAIMKDKLRFDLAGQTLTFDIKVSGTATTPAGPAIVRLYIGEDSSDYFMTTNAYSASLSTGGWTSYKVPIVLPISWPARPRRARPD